MSTSCKSPAEKCSKTLETIKRILRQNGIEKLWQQRILRQIGIQIDQSEDGKISQSENREIDNRSAVRPQVHVIRNKKSTELSTTSAPGQGASTESAPCLSKQYKKPKRQLFNPILSRIVEQSTSIPTRVSPRCTSASAASNCNGVKRYLLPNLKR